MDRRLLVFFMCAALLLCGFVGTPSPAHAEGLSVSVSIGGEQPIKAGKVFSVRIVVTAPAGQHLRKLVIDTSGLTPDTHIKYHGMYVLPNGSFVDNSSGLTRINLDKKSDDKVGFSSATIQYSYVALEGATQDLQFTLTKAVGVSIDGSQYFQMTNPITKTIAMEDAQAESHEHAFTRVVSEVLPTCTESGVTEQQCDGCDETFTETIPAMGHDPAMVMLLAAKCESAGRQQLQCLRCDVALGEVEEILALQHMWDEGITHTSPTCTEPGATTYTCALCSDVKTEYPPALGHAALVSHQQPATCTEDGVEHLSCSVCHDTVDEDILPATGHQYPDEWIVLGEDCTVMRTRVRTCMVAGCGEEQIEEMAAHPEHLLETKSVLATCEESGENVTKCTRCKYQERVIVPPLQHRYSLWVTHPVPTCVEPGSRSRTCTRCHIMETEVVPVTSDKHDFSGPLAFVLKPTCVEWGVAQQVCRVEGCGEVKLHDLRPNGHQYQDEWSLPEDFDCAVGGARTRECLNCSDGRQSEVIEAGQHLFGAWQVTSDATCKFEGLRTRLCDVCSHEERESIPQSTKHNSGATRVLKSATCKEEGAIGRTCLDCGIVLYSQVTRKLPHAFGEWKRREERPCTELRLDERNCIDCGASETKDIPAGQHRFPFSWDVVVSPGCTTKGTEKGVCQDCGHEETRDLPRTGHLWSGLMLGRKATCYDAGYLYQQCQACSEIKEHEQMLEKHTWSDWTVHQQNSCLGAGLRSRQCTVEECKFVEEEELPLLAHESSEWEEITPASCTQLGQRKSICGLCDTVFLEDIPLSEHTYGEYKRVKEPACGIDGVERRTCLLCQHADVKAIDKLFHVWTVWETQLAPACEREGKGMKTCTLCGVEEFQTIAAEEHTFGPWGSRMFSDCVVGGNQTRICEKCQAEDTRALKPVKHYFAAWQTILKATCDAPGIRERVCRRCDMKETEETAVRKHVYGKWTLTSRASCARPGIQERTCKHCSHTEHRETKLLKHQSGPWKVTKRAALFQAGVQSRICKRCGETLATRGYNEPKSKFAVSFCAFGLRICDLQPERTDAWYTLTPIDLTKKGMLRLPLIADDSHVIGEIVVDIREGKLKVSQELSDSRTEILKPSVRFFADVRRITAAELEKTDHSVGFERSIDIARSFKDADVVFMSVRCEGVFDQYSKKNPPFAQDGMLENGTTYQELLERMMHLAGFEDDM